MDVQDVSIYPSYCGMFLVSGVGCDTYAQRYVLSSYLGVYPIYCLLKLAVARNCDSVRIISENWLVGAVHVLLFVAEVVVEGVTGRRSIMDVPYDGICDITQTHPDVVYFWFVY